MVQGHSRSLKWVPVESPCAGFFEWLIVTEVVGLSPTVSEILGRAFESCCFHSVVAQAAVSLSCSSHVNCCTKSKTWFPACATRWLYRMIQCSFVWTQYQHVTDRRVNRQTDMLSIAKIMGASREGQAGISPWNYNIFVRTKRSEIVATKHVSPDQNIHKCVCGPAEGAYSTPSDYLAGFKGLLRGRGKDSLQGEKRRGREGKERKRLDFALARFPRVKKWTDGNQCVFCIL